MCSSFTAKVESRYFLPSAARAVSDHPLVRRWGQVVADFKTARTTFAEDGVSEAVIDDYFNTFKKIKQRIKEPRDRDIDQWVKRGWRYFKTFVDELSGTPSKREQRRAVKVEGADLVAENSRWFVVRITTYPASCTYGRGTKWCTTQSKHWDSYVKDHNFYYIISKNRPTDDPLHKIALVVSDRGGEYFDATDALIRESEIATLDIPTFKAEYGAKVGIDGKTYTLEEFTGLKNLKVKGDLDLGGTKVTELPPGLKVGGGLHLGGSEVSKLPPGLKVGGALDLRKTEVSELPPGLKVGGYLDLVGTKVTELPPGLKVGGDLNLSGTKVTELPPGLKVGGGLDLQGTKVIEIPPGLKVRKFILTDRGQLDEQKIPEHLVKKIRTFE